MRENKRERESEEIENEIKQNEDVNERYLNHTFVNSKKIKKVRMRENERESYENRKIYCENVNASPIFPFLAAAPSDLLYT